MHESPLGSITCKQKAVHESPFGVPHVQTQSTRSLMTLNAREDSEATDQKAYAVSEAFAVRTTSGKPGCCLLIDTGSPNDLMGEEFHKDITRICRIRGVTAPQKRKRNVPLRVGGIGNGSQQADVDAKFSIGINQRFDKHSSCPKFAEFAGPVLPQTDVPGIIGQRSLRENRVILDCYNLRMYTIGPGSAKTELPPGSEMYDLQESKEGHLMLPCDQFPDPRMKPTPGPMKSFHTATDCECE